LKWRMGVSAEEYDEKRLELCRVVYRCRDYVPLSTRVRSLRRATPFYARKSHRVSGPSLSDKSRQVPHEEREPQIDLQDAQPEESRRWADFSPPSSPLPSTSLTEDNSLASSSPTSTNSGPTVSNSTVTTSPNQGSSCEGDGSLRAPSSPATPNATLDLQGTPEPRDRLDPAENRRWADFTPPHSPQRSRARLAKDDLSASSTPTSTNSGPTVSNSTLTSSPNAESFYSFCEGDGSFSLQSQTPFKQMDSAAYPRPAQCDMCMRLQPHVELFRCELCPMYKNTEGWR
jgi:hypothetical protein